MNIRASFYFDLSDEALERDCKYFDGSYHFWFGNKLIQADSTAELRAAVIELLMDQGFSVESY